MGHIGALEEIKDGFLEAVSSKLRPGRLAGVRREFPADDTAEVTEAEETVGEQLGRAGT